MPRYKYQCSACEEVKTYFHAMEEVMQNCEICGGVETLEKLLTTPFIKKQHLFDSTEQKVGELTKQYIEENRKILDEQKKEILKREFKPDDKN